MSIIKKWWVRFIVSGLLGGMISEALSTATNGQINLNAFFIAIVLYLILSVVYGFHLRKNKTN